MFQRITSCYCTSHWTFVQWASCGLLILLMCGVHTAKAQVEQEPVFRVAHLSVEEGLSQSTVSSIAQDAQGFLWFATSDGLNKYDGNVVVVFKHDGDNAQSPPADDLTSLGISGIHTVWVGSSTGLFRYDKYCDCFKSYRPRSLNPIVDEHTPVNCISPLDDNTVWVGTQLGLGVATQDSGTVIPQQMNRILNAAANLHSIDAVCETRLHGVWISGDTQLVYVPPLKEKGELVSIPGPASVVRTIFEDAEGVMWFGTLDARVFRFEPRRTAGESLWKLYSVGISGAKSQFGNLVSSIAQDHTGRLWIGTRLGGLFTIDRMRKEVASYQVPITGERFEGVKSIIVDRSGLVWVGYDGAGVVKINPEPKQIHHFLLSSTKNSAEDGENFLKPILADHRGRWWLGTYDRGLTMIDRRTGERTRFVHDPKNEWSLPTSHLITLGEDLQGRIWVGTSSGIARWDEAAKRFHRYNSLFSVHDSISDGTVWSFCFDSSGSIYAGVGNGLLRYDPALDRFYQVLKTDSIKNNWIESLAAAPDSTLWIGTVKTGLLHVDKEYRVSEGFGTFLPGTVCDNFIKSILLEPDGTLWAGTTEGLSRRDPLTKEWTSYHRKDGLPDEMIYGILAVGGHSYWFSTNRGIVRMHADGSARPQFKVYTPDDGLQSYEFNTNCYYKAPTGELLFGGINGLNYFYPDSVVDNTHSPEMALTQFKKFDQHADLGIALECDTAVTLAYTESVFSFEFSALEYTNPGRNTYAYQLVGYDREWVECGNRRDARYTNLNPGEYVFRVRGRNNDGIQSVRDAVVTITIVPPFWRTVWFFTLAVIAIAGGFGGTVRYVSTRKMRARLEALEQEQAIERHRRETREAIARDLHDDVSSTLSSMALYVESTRLRLPPGTGESDTALSRLQVMAREAEDAMEHAVWSLSPYHQGLTHLMARIHDVAIERCGEHNIGCSVTIPELTEDVAITDIARKNCFLIFRECLANAVKHAQPAQVTISIDITDGVFLFTISDDGVGFERDVHLPKSRGGNGLKNIKTRAQEMGAELTVISGLGMGTTITLSTQLAQMRY